MGHAECAALLEANADARALVGRCVELGGLLGKAELNGRRGDVTGYEPKRERCVVALSPLWWQLGRGRAAPLLLKRANLTPCDDDATPRPTNRGRAAAAAAAVAIAVVAVAAAYRYVVTSVAETAEA